MTPRYQRPSCKSSAKPTASHAGNSRKERKKARKAAKKARQRLEAQFPLPICQDEVVDMLHQSLDTFAIEMGLLVAEQLLKNEVEQLCGERYAHDQSQIRTRYGRQPGYIVMAGQKLHIDRPRVRDVDKKKEVPLENYQAMQNPNAMSESALRRMIHGVSTRNYETVIDVATDGFGVKRSSVSRAYVRASGQAVQQLAERSFAGERFPVIFIDGVEYAGETMICALGVTPTGAKRILGMRQGATENAEVVTAFLEDLREHGLNTSAPTLFVLDGSKALAAGVKKVCGKKALIQRCQVHKKRNVQAHLAKEHWPELARRLHEAYTATDYGSALALLRGTATWLAKINPAAAASMREGMEETLTVVKLGVPSLLRKTVSSTNPIESAFKIVRDVTRRVKSWRPGNMRQRWCVAGLLRAEKAFHRVKGHRHLPLLIKALDEEVSGGQDQQNVG